MLYPYTTFDPDTDPVSVVTVTLTTGPLPSFIAFTQTGLTINPIAMADVNVYTI